MVAAIVRWCLGHRRATLIAAGAVLALAAAGCFQLRIDFSSASFYADDDRQRAELEEFQRRFGPDDSTAVVIVRDAGRDLLTPTGHAAIAHATRALDQTPEVTSAISLASFVGPSVPRVAVLAHPVASPALVSRDGTTAAILVDLGQSSDDLLAVIPRVEAVEAVVERIGVETGLELELAGVPAVRAAFFRLTIHDQLRFVPATLLVIGVLLFVAFRRLDGVVVPGLAAVTPVVLLAGTLGWVGEPLGLLNQAYFTLIPVIAVADSVHLVTRARREPVQAAASRVGFACLLTSVTTAAGFASLGTAAMPAVRSFGLFAALGIAFAYVTVITVVPVLLAMFEPSADRPGAVAGAAVATARFGARHPILVLVVTASLTASAASIAANVEIDNRLTTLLEPDHPVRRASDRVDAELGGILSLEVELSPRTDTAAREAFIAWARELPEVRTVVPQPDREGYGHVSVRVADQGGRAFAVLEQQVRDRFASTQLDATVTGTTAMAYRGVNAITDDLLTSFALAFVVVTAVTGLALRRASAAAVSILPNLVPLLVGYAAVGAVGMTLDPLATVVLVVGLGIAVDDTIHLLVAYRERINAGDAPATAIEAAAATAGRAVVITSACLAAGLAVNLASSFPPLKVLGALGATVILTALVFDLLLLPALLAGFAPKRAPASRPESEPPAAAPR